MTACRARSSGSPSSRSCSSRRGQGLGSRSARVREHEVHGLADRLDARGLLVGHPHAVGVLELLHEAVEVERVRLEVLLEARALLDARRIELELVGQVRADVGEDLVSRHGSGTVAAAADGLGCASAARSHARRSAPAAASRSCVRPTTSARTPRAASSIARAIPSAPNEPCGTTPEPPQAEQERAALRLGVDRVAQPAERRPQQQPAGLRARARRRRLAHRAQQRVRGPLHHLEEHVAGEAVGHDHVGLARADREALDVAGEGRAPSAAPASAACAARTSSVPFVGSVAVGQQRDARALEPDHGLHERRAHVRELDEVLGPHLDVRAAVEQQERAARAPAPARRAPAGGRRARA